jgi:hypothetical protein
MPDFYDVYLHYYQILDYGLIYPQIGPSLSSLRFGSPSHLLDWSI